MTLKQLWLGFSILMALSMSAVATAKPIVYKQTHLLPATIAKFPYIGRNVSRRLQFNIINNTGVPWTDYTFFFYNTAVMPAPKYRVSISNIKINGKGGFTKNRVNQDNAFVGRGPLRKAAFTLFKGLIKPNAMFMTTFTVAYTGPLTIYGNPSIGVPEPPSLVLFGLGFVALIVLKRAARA